jgi:hypothetical protein
VASSFGAPSMLSCSGAESIVEDAALAWLEGLGYAPLHGPDLALDQPGAGREDSGQVVLADRLRRAGEARSLEKERQKGKEPAAIRRLPAG